VTVRTLTQAARYIDKVGWCLLFPKKGSDLPSLHEAAGRPEDWDGDMARFWGWKDELPLRGLAWYGVLVRGLKSFVSPALLADMYPRSGRVDDFRALDLSPAALSIADELLAQGPSPASLLRQVVGRKEYERATKELFRQLVITHYGTEEQPSGWPSAVIELTARAFPVKKKGRELAVAVARLEDIRQGRNAT